MSVDFAPSGNWEYCDTHGITIRDTRECLCAPYGHTPDPDCWCCGGTGKETTETYPFELHVSNSNARTLLDALGLGTGEELYGSINADLLLERIEGCVPAVCLATETREYHEPGKAHVVFFGTSADGIQQKLDALKEIALEAKRRGVDVVWG